MEDDRTLPEVPEQPNHERSIQAVRPSALSAKNNLLTRVVGYMQEKAGEILGKTTSPQGSDPTLIVPRRKPKSATHDSTFALLRLTETQINNAPNLLDKMAIVDKMTVTNENELARALYIIHRSCAPYQAGLLQTLLAANIKNWSIPMSAAVKILGIPHAVDVQRLLIEGLEKKKPSEEQLFGMMAVLKNTDTIAYLLEYFGFTFKAVEPVPGQDAYLTPEKITKALEKDSGFKAQSHLGLAHLLKPDPSSKKNILDQASTIAVQMHDAEAIQVAFLRMGIKVTANNQKT